MNSLGARKRSKRSKRSEVSFGEKVFQLGSDLNSRRPPLPFAGKVGLQLAIENLDLSALSFLPEKLTLAPDPSSKTKIKIRERGGEFTTGAYLVKIFAFGRVRGLKMLEMLGMLEMLE